jgi:hypothetical protein
MDINLREKCSNPSKGHWKYTFGDTSVLPPEIDKSTVTVTHDPSLCAKRHLIQN